jgi:hypothetical protein
MDKFNYEEILETCKLPYGHKTLVRDLVFQIGNDSKHKFHYVQYWFHHHCVTLTGLDELLTGSEHDLHI